MFPSNDIDCTCPHKPKYRGWQACTHERGIAEGNGTRKSARYLVKGKCVFLLLIRDRNLYV